MGWRNNEERVRAAISDTLANTENLPDYSDEPAIEKGKRSMCDFFLPKLGRMSIYDCAKCNKTYSLEYRSQICLNCDVKKQAKKD